MYLRRVPLSHKELKCLGEPRKRAGFLPTIFYFLVSCILLFCGPQRHYKRIVPMFERYEKDGNTAKGLIHALEHKEETPAIQGLLGAWKGFAEALLKEWCLCILMSGVFSTCVPFPN